MESLHKWRVRVIAIFSTILLGVFLLSYFQTPSGKEFQIRNYYFPIILNSGESSFESLKESAGILAVTNANLGVEILKSIDRPYNRCLASLSVTDSLLADSAENRSFILGLLHNITSQSDSIINELQRSIIRRRISVSFGKFGVKTKNLKHIFGRTTNGIKPLGI